MRTALSITYALNLLSFKQSLWGTRFYERSRASRYVALRDEEQMLVESHARVLTSHQVLQERKVHPCVHSPLRALLVLDGSSDNSTKWQVGQMQSNKVTGFLRLTHTSSFTYLPMHQASVYSWINLFLTRPWDFSAWMKRCGLWSRHSCHLNRPAPPWSVFSERSSTSWRWHHFVWKKNFSSFPTFGVEEITVFSEPQLLS